MRVDFQVHTSVGGAKNTPAEMAAVAKKRGLDAIAITDTGTIDGWKNFNPQSFTVIPAVEVEVTEGKVLIFGVKTVPDLKDVPRLLEWAKKGGYFAVPVLNGPLAKWAMQFDVVEAINGNQPPWVCKDAVKKCTAANKKFICASGARSVAQLGKFYTSVETEREGWEGIIRAMRKGDFEPRIKFPGIGDMVRSRF